MLVRIVWGKKADSYQASAVSFDTTEYRGIERATVRLFDTKNISKAGSSVRLEQTLFEKAKLPYSTIAQADACASAEVAIADDHGKVSYRKI